ncbi:MULTISPECIES: hypothetical protein [Paenibacillus]|uniref:hypothetical protein n=1 Tax=Paenibacillus TaxID=44249 RepID=UPI00096F47A2|nr:hypothetical protein [Paenibacillus odorifer]OME13959.1 hypothetical protein BSK60_13980 [Paenibacillus odorifer]
MIPEREEIMRSLARHYYYFLNRLPFEDKIYMNSMREARNKFLANCHITLIKPHLPKKYNNWRYSTDYVSMNALERLMNRKWESSELVYEHVIPKKNYIINECEAKARDESLTEDFIYQILIKKLWTATINKEENLKLTKMSLRSKMPNNWDEEDVMARYKAAGIQLIPHEKNCYFKDVIL